MKRGCPDLCLPFKDGAKIKPTFQQKALCPTGNCLPDDPAKKKLEDPQMCPLVNNICWKTGAWQKANPNEPSCNIKNKNTGYYNREVICPGGESWKCKDNAGWVGSKKNIKPASVIQKKYDRDCYEVLFQRDKETGAENVEWDICRSTKTIANGINLTCGEALHKNER